MCGRDLEWQNDVGRSRQATQGRASWACDAASKRRGARREARGPPLHIIYNTAQGFPFLPFVVPWRATHPPHEFRPSKRNPATHAPRRPPWFSPNPTADSVLMPINSIPSHPFRKSKPPRRSDNHPSQSQKPTAKPHPNTVLFLTLKAQHSWGSCSSPGDMIPAPSAPLAQGCAAMLA